MTQPASTTGTILVVDDTAENLHLLSKILKANGYDVRPAPSGRLALRAAQAEPPDVILLDINMPEMDGYEVCRRLKQNEELKEIPVLFLSARMDIEDKVKAFSLGGVDYITKPFQLEEVLSRIRTHLHLRRLQLESVRQNERLETALQQLKTAQKSIVQSEKMAALGVLLAGIAHEINNPVNFIKASVTGLQNDFNDLMALVHTCSGHVLTNNPDLFIGKLEKIKEEIDFETLVREISDLFSAIQEGIRRTEEITSSLRVLSREDERAVLDVDIHKILDASLTVLRNRIKHRINIDKAYSSLPGLTCQPGKIGQLFTNIISNAVDALLDKSLKDVSATLSIQTRSERHEDTPCIAVRIADNGPGIPDSIISKIFDPFFTTKEVGKGTGLGLYISHEIVKEHHGTLHVESSSGRGATFSVILPLTQE